MTKSITYLQNSSTATRRPNNNPPISHWARKPVSSPPRKLPHVLVDLQPVLDVHRCRRRLEDREQSFHFLFVVVMWEYVGIVRFNMGERVVCLSAECREVTGRGRAALAPTGLFRAK